ncbi:efflux RND transporter permease subunit [Marinithermus hydrothermalis]|uniref:Efflux transporter, hydrophobe/amphiphile efflux-3 (HAE3) family n=1 Tax=Marinithermus hydrothermalis (strain DSM 14884 / JCM 11576 / T1) TaxID=869210 RepID=F2NN81_MARHT|nr:MMPL family transporter [Marinithermus hydrothermalis]AEB12820.1 efflux transporter,  hydrophobe/amphiphile efflux-3 (HAE3) family [Marinithermus hydrothermalis DSM 14884]
MERLSRFATRHPWIVLGTFLVLSVILGLGLPRLEFDNSPEAMVPPDLPAKRLLDEVEETFGTGSLAVAALEGEIYTPEALTQLREATQALEEVPGVLRVTSLATAKRMEEDAGFLLIEDLVPEAPLTPEDVQAIRAYVASSPLYQGKLVSEDARYAAVLISVERGADMRALERALRDTLEAHWDGPVYLAGIPVMSGAILDTLQRDLPLQVSGAALIIGLVLFLNFRSLRGVFLPLVTVGVALVWALGAGGWLGFKLGMISSILPVVVLAVGSSFTLHILNRYYHELAEGRPKTEAIRLAVRETGLGVLISALAAGAGLAALYTASLPQIQAFGLLSAFGVLVAFIGSTLIVPAILSFLRPPRRVFNPERPDTTSRTMVGLARWVIPRRKGLLVGAGGFVLTMLLGASQIQVETSFTSYFPPTSPARVGTDLIDRVFRGSDTLTVVVEGDLKNPALLRGILAFEEAAQALPEVGAVLSVADVIQEIHKALTGERGIPDTSEGVAQEILLYQMSGNPEEITQLMDEGATIAQITVQLPSLPSSEMERTINELQTLAQTYIAPHAGTVEFTGSTVLMLEIMRLILRDQLISLALALILVALFNTLLLRSAVVGAVSVLPLALTIAGQFGLMGIAGIPLDTATALLAAIAIGVGDYSVHVIVRYLEERRKQAAPEMAVRTALFVSGRAVVFTALAIGGGFSALLWSGFVPIQTFGKLMGFTVGATALFALSVLPAALLAFVRKNNAREVTQHA